MASADAIEEAAERLAASHRAYIGERFHKREGRSSCCGGVSRCDHDLEMWNAAEGLLAALADAGHKRQVAAQAEMIARLLDQLPDGMERCTIVALECLKGHTRLVGTNWTDTGCDVCKTDAATKRAEEAEAKHAEAECVPYDIWKETYQRMEAAEKRGKEAESLILSNVDKAVRSHNDLAAARAESDRLRAEVDELKKLVHPDVVRAAKALCTNADVHPEGCCMECGKGLAERDRLAVQAAADAIRIGQFAEAQKALVAESERLRAALEEIAAKVRAHGQEWISFALVLQAIAAAALNGGAK